MRVRVEIVIEAESVVEAVAELLVDSETGEYANVLRIEAVEEEGV